MKTLTTTIILSFIVLASMGCNNNPDNKQVASNKAEFEVIVIDKCQYLYSAHGAATFFTHKGNCNNPIHKR